MYGHLNNVIYYELFDTAVNKWLINNNLIEIENGNIIGLIVQSGCNYFSSFKYPDDIDAGIRVAKIGNSSVRYEVGLFKQKDELASADGFFIHVYVDRKTNNPISLDYELTKYSNSKFNDNDGNDTYMKSLNNINFRFPS